MAESASGKRPKLILVSSETRRVCLLLAEELLRWPEVNARTMFGLRAFYRAAAVFAMLPDKRALKTPRGIAYKLGDKWQSFELNDEHGVSEALARLNQAYALATLPTRKDR
jgi:hypothetical protein